MNASAIESLSTHGGRERAGAVSASAAGNRHRLVALLVTLLAVALAVPAASLTPTTQAILLGIGVLLTGVPHGAVDHLRVAPLLRKPLGKSWLPVFLLGYVMAALVVVGIWWLWPIASLLGFLALSAHHFGSGDADDVLGVLVHGSLPILVPTAAHPEAVAELFALLTASDPASWAAALRAAQPLLVGLAVLLLLTLVVARWRRPRGSRGEVVELLALAAAAWWLPPLLSFAIYFCVWHAPRHILHVAQELRPGTWRRALAGFGRAALPMTLATVAGGLTMVALLPPDPEPLRRWLQLIFIGLAALTVPHLLVTERLRHR